VFCAKSNTTVIQLELCKSVVYKDNRNSLLKMIFLSCDDVFLFQFSMDSTIAGLRNVMIQSTNIIGTT